MDFLKKNSLQRKFMNYFVIASFALFLTVGILFFNNTKTVINASKENELKTLSLETSNKIGRFLFERYGDIQVMAQSPLLREQNINSKLKIEYLQSVRNAYKTYDYILITDKNGAIDVFSGNIDKKNIFSKALPNLLKKQIYVSDYEIDSKNKITSLYFAAPIIDYNNKFKGAVIERMNFKSIDNIINNVKSGKSGYAYLSNQHWVSDKNNRINYLNIKGKNFIAAFYPITKYETQTLTWQLVVKEPVNEAFQVTDSVKKYTISLVLISVCGLFILAYIMSRFITQPIKNLVLQAQSIAKGDSRKNVNITSTDEVGSLANSFNLLLSSLDSMMQKVLELSGEAASLADIRQYTNKFFNDIPSAVITIDGSGVVTTFNETAASITGISAESMINTNIIFSRDKKLYNLFSVIKDSLTNKKTYFKHIVEIKDTDDNPITIMVNTTVQQDDDEKTFGVICVFRRLDETKKLEESIIRARNLTSLGELSAGMAHEIRNPLTSIRGYAQYIKRELGNDSELTQDINVILSEVDRLNGIIDRFLTFARPKQPKFENVNLNDIINDVLHLLNKEQLSENIHIETKLQDLPDFKLDYEQIKQAILNLALNSIQAMNNNGTLSIKTNYVKSSNYAELEIIDTGIGISPQDFDKIFEPFYTTKDKGTGLGLAITSRIIENHNGFIEVKSEKGIGTQFVIKLPLNIGLL